MRCRMLQRIDDMAAFSIARGCGFAMIAIATTMIGLSFDAHQSLRTGALLSLLTTLILILRAMRAYAKPYDATELWLMLAPAERPPQSVAQLLVGRALRQAYYRFALYFAHGAVALLLLDVVVALIA